jgi:hypothetical protein
MTVEKAIRILAGTMVLLSLALGRWVSPWWLLLTAFVGVNLIQSVFTGFCPAEMIFRKMGLPECTQGSAGNRAVKASENN